MLRYHTVVWYDTVYCSATVLLNEYRVLYITVLLLFIYIFIYHIPGTVFIYDIWYSMSYVILILICPLWYIYLTTKFVDKLGVSLYIPFSTSLKQSYIKAISHFYTLMNALLFELWTSRITRAMVTGLFRTGEAASWTGEGRERPVTPAKIMKISKIALVAIKFVQFKISTAGYLYFCRWDDPTIGSRSGEGWWRFMLNLKSVRSDRSLEKCL